MQHLYIQSKQFESQSVFRLILNVIFSPKTNSKVMGEELHFFIRIYKQRLLTAPVKGRRESLVLHGELSSKKNNSINDYIRESTQ